MLALKQKDIFRYSLGDLGINLNFQLIGFYLAYFYTDVFGISAAHVAGLFLIARIWDAVNDPIMGFIADHTKSRWGRFRPYILFGAIPLNLILLACFYTPELSDTGKVIYAYVTYITHGICFTLVSLPYSSISAVMTQDQQERAVISTYRMFFAVVVALGIIGVGVKPFVNLFATEQQGFFVAACVLGASSIILLWTSFFFSKERVEVPAEKYHLKDIIPIIIKNDALLVLAGAMLLNTAVWVTGNAVALYYFKYVLGNADLQSTFFMVMLPANMLGAFVTPFITKRFGKLKTFMWASLGVAIFSLSRHFIPDDQLTLIFAVSGISSFAMMFCSIAQWGMLPDTVEYGHWKTGQRSEGIPFAFFSFMQKSAMALAGSVAAYAMFLSGYEANTVLTASADRTIRWLFNIVPAAYSTLCFIVLLFYKIDGPLYKKIITELSSKEDKS
ncbi:MFS transporter [Lentisphaera marina]|uniref:MFS transporter n=1 Tax=Lentisphaera marina TaxID=1111041 RepID=UPI0023669E32|nr:MFS transporter [Lentisphaera marina]MDD7984304.1 MFS transporter [Lentisphaera marina]